jgi:DNA-binding NtrC family response regulator
MLKRSVIYLDDEAGCLKIFRDFFESEYDVRTTSTPEEARRMLAERPADVIISDQAMPDMNGKDFLAEVAAQHPSVYRVLLTGSITVAGALREIGGGVVQAFVTKPWSKEEIARVIERGSADDELWMRAGSR